MKTRHIRLDGPTGYHDYPPIPSRLHTEFEMRLWDDGEAGGELRLTGPAPPGANDVVSRTVDELGVWEPVETIVMLSAFRANPNAFFLDLGCQLGWYTHLAVASKVRGVLAVDANTRALEMVAASLELNPGAQRVTLLHGVVSTDARLTGTGPFIVKMDIEGAEPDAIIALEPRLATHEITHLLIEVSPVFNDRYTAALHTLIDHGYRLYALPDKRAEPPDVGNVRAYLDAYGDRLDNLGAELETYLAERIQFNAIAFLDPSRVGLTRVGLIARANARGLAVQTKNFHDGYGVASTLLVTVDEPRWPDDHTLYPGARVVTWVGDRSHLEPATAVAAFLDEVDTVFSVETLYCSRLARMAAARHVLTVVQGNPEFYRQRRAPGFPSPDRWTWPTPWLTDAVPVGPVLAVPVSGRSTATAADPDDDTLVVVHVGGKRALGDRNGTELLVDALRQLDARRVHVRLYSQDGQLPDLPALGRHVSVESFPDGVTDRWTMYDGAHLLILPRRYGGLSLPVLEAMESGLAVAMTECPPNDIWPIVPIRAGPGRVLRMPVGQVTTTVAAPRLIALTVADLARHRDTLADAMTAARQWAAANTWDVLRPEYERILLP